MLDFVPARDKAVYYAIETGKMPNIHLIHTIQKTEGYEQCFGRATSACPHSHCRWHHECMALMAFTPPTDRPACEFNKASESRSAARSSLTHDKNRHAKELPQIPLLSPSRSKDKLVLVEV